MKRLLFTVVLIALTANSSLVRKTLAGESETDAAKKAADAWLILIDSGKYSESWDQSAQMFKEHVTKEQWTSALNSVRSPLGNLESRELRTANYTKTLPGASSGDYVVIQFDTNFEKKKSSVETVTSTKEKDGQWRVTGFFIK